MSVAIIGANDLSGNTASFPILPPFPMLGGKLFACHLGGSAWRRDASEDYSGNEHALSLRNAVQADYYYEGRNLLMPILDFTTDQLVARTGKMTFMTVANINSSTPTSSAMSSAPGGSAASVSLNYGPTSSSRIMAYNTDTAGSTAANLTLPSEGFDQPCFMGSIHTATTVEAFAKPKDDALITMTPVTTAKPAAGASPFYVYKTTSDATAGSVKGYATAFYDDALTDTEIETAYASIKAYLAAAGTPVLI